MKNPLIDTRAIITACTIAVVATLWTSYVTLVRLELLVERNTTAITRNILIDERQTAVLNDLVTQVKVEKAMRSSRDTALVEL